MSHSSGKARGHRPLRWVFESIIEEPSFLEKPMFGCQAGYLHGRLMLLLCSGEEPWNGLLIPTDHRHHESILREFGEVLQHPVLKKWLYLPEASEDFESAVSAVVGAIAENDPRFGVEPKEKKGRRKKADQPDTRG